MSGFGWFGNATEALTVEQGEAQGRWEQATSPTTSEDTLFELASHPDPHVGMGVAGNVGASARVLRELCAHHPEFEEIARLNRNAPADMKDVSPLAEQSEDSVFVYLDERGATAQQRQHFVARFRRLRAPGGPTVGDVWRDISAE